MTDFKNSKRTFDGLETSAAKKPRTLQGEDTASGISDDRVTTRPGDEDELSLLLDAEETQENEKILEVESALEFGGLTQEALTNESEPSVIDADIDSNDFGQDSQEVLGLLGHEPGVFINWGSILLKLIDESVPGTLKHQLATFFDGCQMNEEWRGASSEPIDAFLDNPSGGWSSHDTAIDQHWNNLVREVTELSEGKIEASSLSKPSGPLNAVLTFIWHYPTWYTKRALYGHVMDPTNPSLRAQKEKMGLSPLIRTQNRIPVRENFSKAGVDWTQVYPNWNEIQDKFSDFNRRLNKCSKVIVRVGEENSGSLSDILEIHDTAEVIEVPLDLQFQVFGSVPSFQVIQDRSTKVIQHVVFASYHSQTFYYRNVDIKLRAYHDLLWNGVADLVWIDPRSPTYFLRQKDINRPSTRKSSIIDQAIKLCGFEKKTEVVLQEFVVRRIFGQLLEKNSWSDQLAPSEGSWVRGVIKLMGHKATAAVQTDAYRNSEEGKRFAAARAESLQSHRAKSAATKQSAEWKASEKGQKTISNIKRASKMPRNKWNEKYAAVLKTKQAKELQALDEDDVPSSQVRARWHLDNIYTLTTNQRKSFFRDFVQLYTPDTPGRLRYEGDTGPPDDFPYDDQYHPAVKLTAKFTEAEKAAFLVQS